MEERIKAIMADIFLLDPSEIGANTSMESLPQWDSLAHIDLIGALEEEFDVMFEVDDFEHMTDFQSVLNKLTEKT